MKQLIKYAAVIFALVLAASIIGGCLTAGVAVVKMIVDKTEDSAENNRNDGNGIWYRDEDGDVVFFGIRFGGSEDVKSGTESFAASEIDSMYLEVGAGELVVEPWEKDEISVVYENIPEEYEIYTDGETLVIEQEDNFVLWGTSFNKTPKITVSVPEDKLFEEIEVDKGSGSAKIRGILVEDLNVDNGSGGLGVSNIKVKEFSVDSGSGGVNISDSTAEKSVFHNGSGGFIVQNSKLGVTSMDSGSGFVNFENVVAENMVVDSGSGRVDMTGVLTGNCVFESGSGSLNVQIYGEEEDYNIRTDMGSGSFYLNGDKETDNYIEHNNAEHLLVFDAGSGRVSVEFKNVPAGFETEQDVEQEAEQEAVPTESYDRNR